MFHRFYLLFNLAGDSESRGCVRSVTVQISMQRNLFKAIQAPREMNFQDDASFKEI
jgi:hypothetical protein